MIFNRLVFEYFRGDDCILEQEQMQRLTPDKQLRAYRHEGCLFAMNSYREYKYLNELWEEGKDPEKVWEWVSFGAEFSVYPTEVWIKLTIRWPHKPGLVVDLSWLVAKLVETGFLATYAWDMKLDEVMVKPL